MDNNNLPDYEALFGALDFKEGDEARSVYSPAAYLADLLQLMDDEFIPADVNKVDARRDDIRGILLDSENTYTLIPYLGIVNEVLEHKIGTDVYTNQLLNAPYPFNLPFNLHEEEVKLYLKYLGISPEKLHKLFAVDKKETADINEDNTILAHEYLGLYPEDNFLIGVSSNDVIESYYGYTPDPNNPNANFLTDMSVVSTFLEKTELTGLELRELLYQNLREEEYGLQSDYLINAYSSFTYALLDETEENIVQSGSSPALTYRWFESVYRFVRLAKKTGISFTDLDLILRSTLKTQLDDEAIRHIAVVKKLHETLELPIDVVVALMKRMNEHGHSEETEPKDLFNRVFNNDCAKLDKKYIRGTGDVPQQFIDEGYTEIPYADDLFSEANYDFRKRVMHVLGLSKTDLEKIIQRLDDQEVNESLWMNSSQKMELLNFLYRFTQLAQALDMSHDEVFTLFELLKQDPSVTRFNQHNTFINELPYTQDCYAIIMGYSVGNMLWLIQSLIALKDWMQAYDFTADMLWYIATGDFKNEKAEQESTALTISQLNGLYQAFKGVHLSAETFLHAPFDKRSARLIQRKLLELRTGETEAAMKLVQENEEQAAEVAHMAIEQLSKITEYDFMDLGIEEPLVEKIFRNLIYRNYIDPKGLIFSETFPEKTEDFQLETDFTPYLEQVFAIIHQQYRNAEVQTDPDEEVAFSIYPSDLMSLGLENNMLEELYDNLVFNHYINEEGVVQFTEFFSYPNNDIDFDVNTHIGEHSTEVYALLKKQQRSFEEGMLMLKSSAFDTLELEEVVLKDLMENLHFNGYIDEKGYLQNKSKILKEDAESFRLALQFYPDRHAILQAIKDKVAMFQQQYLAVDKALLAEEAEKIVSKWAYEDLQGDYLYGEYLLPESRDFFMEDANQSKLILGYYFENEVRATLFRRMQQIIKQYEKYQLTDQPLIEMKFYPTEINELINLLISQKMLTTARQIPVDKIDYYLESNNALNFNIEGFEDFRKEIFFLLQGIAKHTIAARQKIQKTLSSLASKQEKLLLSQLKGIFGMDAESMKSITKAIFTGAHNLRSAWLMPLFESADALDQISQKPISKAFNTAFSRIKQFSVLANKLRFDQNEVEIAFQEQNLVAKFPETLALPEGVQTIDALLEHGDFVYLFQGGKYWIYRQSDYEIVDKTDLATDADLQELQRKDDELREILEEDAIRLLFEKEGGSLTIDAAFKDKMDNIYLISGNHYYLLMKGEDTWTRRENEFGQIDNDFENITAIDAAYKDTEGHLFLFAGEQYIRYSGDFDFIDEGYPKTINEGWPEEGQDVDITEIFTGNIDASFEGTDGETYFFKGNKFVSSADDVIKDIARHWGKRKHDFKYIDRIDAAFVDGGSTYFFVEDQVVKYTDCLENDGIRVAEGFPKPIMEHFPNLPHEFANGVDASFKGEDGRIHLFKDEYSVSFNISDTTISLEKLVDHWGKLDNNILDHGTVNAALVGLDGKTYIFSGSQYFRYTTGDYSQVDEGYPRTISEDWKGLESIDAAYVLDGKTYLFGLNTAGDAVYVRYSTPDYKEVDEKDEDEKSYITPVGNLPDVEEVEIFPASQDDNWWSLPESLITSGFEVKAALNGLDGKNYLFCNYVDPTTNTASCKVVESDQMHRWWSEPVGLSEKWDKLTFTSIDAAFAGKDGKTYLFSGDQYVCFSDPELCKIDNGYPRKISEMWGNVENTITRNQKVDAALIVESREDKEDDQGNDIEEINTHTYLFSGSQFFRYVNAASGYDTVEPGYPKSIKMLKEEPRFEELKMALNNGIDAAFADHRNVYLFEGKKCHVVSDEQDWVYDNSDFAQITEIVLEEGSVYALDNNQWRRLSALEGEVIDKVEAQPKLLNDFPEVSDAFKNSLDAVLQGADGNTYLFRGTECYNDMLKITYPISEEWGRVSNHIYEHEHIDAAFVGRDGKTYVFSGDQYYTYETNTYVGQELEHAPMQIADGWMGLRSIAYAYVVEEETYLFEHADAYGNFRYAVYTTDNYELEEGSLRSGDFSFWNIPLAQQRAGFDRFDSILLHGENLIFISGQHFIRYNLKEKNWSFPKEIDLLYPDIPFNKTTFKQIQAAFVGADDAVYFFDGECYVQLRNGIFSAPSPVKEDWGLVRNRFEQGVDATLAHDGVTYLFSGNHYVRYSTADYRFVDEGYPKEIAEELRTEEPFMYMAKEFQYALDGLETSNTTVRLNTVFTNERNTYVFINGHMHVGSSEMFKTLDISGLGQVHNNFETLGKVDAAYVDGDDKTYLFSGDQYIRYSGTHYDYVDPGYPKLIEESLAGELGGATAAALPESYRCGIDAAFTDQTGTVYLFKDEHFWDSANQVETPITSQWGKIDNSFIQIPASKSINAAYMDAEGHLFVFKGNQYVRYSDIKNLFSGDDELPKYVDASFPMAIKDHQANLPASFTSNLEGAFRFEGRIYFVKGNEYVMYVEGAHGCDESIYPVSFEYRWGNWSDYLIRDIYLLSRFMDLNTKFMDGDTTLSSLLHKGESYTKEPYLALSEIFGFDKEEVRWFKGMNAFLSRTNAYEQDFDIETIVRMYDVLSEAQRINVEASKLYAQVWQPLYEATRNAQTAAEAIYKMLGTMDCNDNYATLFDQIEREMNTIKRDVLVPYAIATDDEVCDVRDLYQKLLIDVQMENEASTSRIKEATMAIQLFFHRFFLDLEDMDLKGDNDDEVAESLKEQWEWMKNYRVWEANRKVFLYPENYIRPELRDTKTPPFETMEQDLMQGEITDDAVERVYKKYLDEYTEVSRLKIAGGYLFDETDEDNPDLINKKLVLFGRTKSDPIRYYYRFGNFLGGQTETDSWEPWLPVNIPVDSERVYPAYAFNRVFVFWPKIEVVEKDSSDITLTNKDTGNDTNEISSADGESSNYTVKIYYSYYNLNKEWIQPQLLQTAFEDDNQGIYVKDELESSERILNIKLFVESSGVLDGNDHDNILVHCQYEQGNEAKTRVQKAFALTPELYSKKANFVAFENKGKETFERLFDEGPIEDQNVVALNTSEDSLDAPWFCYDHKGGGFLCKPDTVALNTNEWPKERNGNQDSLPEQGTINAAFHSEDGDTTYYFSGGEYFTTDDNGTELSRDLISNRWGKWRLPGASITLLLHFNTMGLPM